MVLKIPYFAKLRKKTIFSFIFLQKTSFMGNRVGNIIFRYVVASVGLFMIAFAIALAIKSNLGTAPLSCVAYVLNLDIPGISVGAFTFLVNMVYILVQLAVLRKRFKLVSLMQVVASVVFGYMIDASLWMLGWLEPAGFGTRLLLILAAAAITALGTSIEVAANAWMVSAEMTVAAFSSTFGKEFGKVKMAAGPHSRRSDRPRNLAHGVLAGLSDALHRPAGREGLRRCSHVGFRRVTWEPWSDMVRNRRQIANLPGGGGRKLKKI